MLGKLLLLRRDKSESEAELLGSNPLLAVAKRGLLRLVQLLVQDGALHPNRATSAEGLTALMVAAEAKRFAVVQWLLQEGAGRKIVGSNPSAGKGIFSRNL